MTLSVKRLRLKIPALLLALTLTACSEPRGADVVRMVLDQQIRLASRRSFRLADATQFAWTRMYVFGPYTPTNKIAATLAVGVPKAKELARGIDTRGDANLLVFQLADGTWTSFTHSRDVADFVLDAKGIELSPETATFQKRDGERQHESILALYAP